MLKIIQIKYHAFMATVFDALEHDEASADHVLVAAKLGSAKYQNNLGTRYNEGKAFRTDHDEAFRWYMEASSQDYIYAQANIAWAYHQGLGVAQSYEEAIVWYRKTAENGHPESQYNLGLMYADGLGTEIDIDEAGKWLSDALSNGIHQAHESLQKLKSET